MPPSTYNSNQLLSFIKVVLEHWKPISVVLGLVVILSFFFPRGTDLLYSYKLDDITREPVIAPFNFPILKTENELNSDLDAALVSEPYLFNRNQDIVSGQIEKLSKFFESVRQIRQARVDLRNSKDLEYRYRFSPEYEEARSMVQSDSAQISILMSAFNAEFPFAEEKDRWTAFLTPPEEGSPSEGLNAFKASLIQICRNRWAEGILDHAKADIISSEIAIQAGDDAATLEFPDSFNDLQQAWTKSRQEITQLYEEKSVLELELGYELIVEFMSPNLVLDRETTERRSQARLDRVPRHKGIVLQNERIVDANTRITPEILEKLNSLSIAVSQREGTEQWIDKALAYLGRLLTIAVVVSFFFTFLLTYRSHIFDDVRMIVLIGLMFLLVVSFAYIFTVRLGLSEYLIPVVVSAMVLTIMFDARIGFMGTTSIALLVGILIGNNVEFIITALFTSSIALFSVRKLRRRRQLFTSIISLLIASVIVVLAQGLFKGSSWVSMGGDLIYLFAMSVLAPIVTYGLIGILEVGFKVTTNLTLLELLDFQHPILKRLQREANGTFNHSVVVGNLAEACADAIGAHSLLCRVGAYYHDIGKMERPEYFIENMFANDNKHDELTPAMSAKIIKQHISDGLKLAKEYGLPQAVSDFIPMHHGTTRVEYFYHKALEEAGGDESKVDDEVFYYTGPRPNTKETGILMICEAVEAAVRSIKEPDILKIEKMMDKIIKKRLAEGQLDKCPLTMDEIRQIRGTVDGNTGMLPVLRGIYHIRIEYPEGTQADAASS